MAAPWAAWPKSTPNLQSFIVTLRELPKEVSERSGVVYVPRSTGLQVQENLDSSGGSTRLSNSHRATALTMYRSSMNTSVALPAARWRSIVLRPADFELPTRGPNTRVKGPADANVGGVVSALSAFGESFFFRRRRFPSCVVPFPTL